MLTCPILSSINMMLNRIALLAVAVATLYGCQPEAQRNAQGQASTADAPQQASTQPAAQPRNTDGASAFDQMMAHTGLARPAGSSSAASGPPVGQDFGSIEYTKPVLKPERLPEQTFSIPAGKAATVATTGGFHFHIPPNAFVDAQGRAFTGNVALAVREAITVNDFIRAGLVTMAGDAPLMSGGMFQLTARDAATGTPLALAPGREIAGITPQMDQPYELFQGQPTPTGALDWVLPVAMPTAEQALATARAATQPPSGTPTPAPPNARTRQTAQPASQTTAQPARQQGAMVRRGLANHTLVPLPDSLAHSLAQFQARVAAAGRVPNLQTMLPENHRDLASFHSRLAKFKAQVDQTRRQRHCRDASNFDEWQNQNLRPLGSTFKFVWFRNNLLAHRSTLGYLGFDGGERSPADPVGIMTDVPRRLRKDWVDITDYYNHWARADEYFQRIFPANVQPVTTCAQAIKAVLLTTHFLQTAAVSPDSARLQGRTGSIPGLKGKLILAGGKTYITVGILGRFGFRGKHLAAADFLRIARELSPEDRTGVSDNELYAHLSALPETGIWAGQVVARRLGQLLVFESKAEFMALMAVLEEEIPPMPPAANTFTVEYTNNLDGGLQSRFGFSVRSLGWYNCDIYTREPWQNRSVVVSLPPGYSANNTQLYVVYPRQRMVFAFPAQKHGTNVTAVRVLKDFVGSLLLVSGDNATSVPITNHRARESLSIGFENPRPLNQALASD